MSRVNDFTSILPADCAEFVFGAYVTDPDCNAYTIYDSEVGDWVIRPVGADDPLNGSFASEGATVTVTAGAVDNDDITNTKSRRIRGIGSIGESEDVVVAAPYGEEIIKESVSPFEFRINNVSTLNRTFFNRMRANPENFTSYFGTEDHLFGADGGVLLRRIKVQMPLEADGNQEIIVRGELVTKGGLMLRSANNPFA